MKKILLGALVGGLIFFLCQAASQMALNLHEPAQQYSASQDSILNYLSTHLKEGGGYMLPRPKNSANLEEVEAFTKSIQGKPWARISYYPTYKMNMGMSMVRSFLTDVLVVFLFLLLVNRFKFKTFGSIFISALFVGIIVFANSFYTLHVWYPSYEIRADLIDALASWGLCGLWLGWLIPDKKRY
ncbi:hypothetical protein EOJ36_02470 [Sandaracinomonas limnophila]|uniref:VanZ-like domain-containing protein n=1 Tax=Sandaracinomonas limnophila TaxID=1862386 RepID=A0A437PXA9_9BACT|nr:hypothetical protein [Sandaracinomonas limnophila]RVU26879.1 hypothetical protein EOJ36_02470 [Sandaracinomonas limnophila]